MRNLNCCKGKTIWDQTLKIMFCFLHISVWFCTPPYLDLPPSCFSSRPVYLVCVLPSSCCQFVAVFSVLLVPALVSWNSKCSWLLTLSLLNYLKFSLFPWTCLPVCLLTCVWNLACPHVLNSAIYVKKLFLTEAYISQVEPMTPPIVSEQEHHLQISWQMVLTKN